MMPCFFFFCFFSWGNFLPADLRLEFKDFFCSGRLAMMPGMEMYSSTSLGFLTWFWWLDEGQGKIGILLLQVVFGWVTGRICCCPDG